MSHDTTPTPTPTPTPTLLAESNGKGVSHAKRSAGKQDMRDLAGALGCLGIDTGEVRKKGDTDMAEMLQNHLSRASDLLLRVSNNYNYAVLAADSYAALAGQLEAERDTWRSRWRELRDMIRKHHAEYDDFLFMMRAHRIDDDERSE